jgi:hypothetical protein
MRATLTKVGEAATFLLSALRDVPTLEFLEQEGSVQIENRGGLENTLRVLGERAVLAAASPRIAAKSKVMKGCGRALPTNALSPKTFCAIIISEAWNFVHDKYPAPRNIKAAAAADAYWRASGGVSRGCLSHSRAGATISIRQNPQQRKKCDEKFAVIALNIPIQLKCLARA